jgi:hypothetical protein
MRKLLILCVVFFFNPIFTLSQGQFYYEFPAEFDPAISNHSDGRWRVNDPELSLHETYGKRREALANGLMLINAPVDLFSIQSASLKLALWGGHPGTSDKQVTVNGKGTYSIPEAGAEEHHCTYSYPDIPLEISHLVNGVNAFQYSCERGSTFWGHFIIDNATLRVTLKSDHADLTSYSLDSFQAEISRQERNGPLQEDEKLSLKFTEIPSAAIDSVVYFGRYYGFDDNGNRLESDWHGFTQNGRHINTLGTSAEAPYTVNWDTRMIPTQPSPMAVKAIIYFESGLRYETPTLNGLVFPDDRPDVMLYQCSEIPVPFWSRAHNKKVAKLIIRDDIRDAEKAILLVKVWDGGAGNIDQPFTLNGHAYNIISGEAIHDVVYTRTEVDVSHLKQGINEFVLLSDTEHHGIEILLPGPCLLISQSDSN